MPTVSISDTLTGEYNVSTVSNNYNLDMPDELEDLRFEKIGNSLHIKKSGYHQYDYDVILKNYFNLAEGRALNVINGNSLKDYTSATEEYAYNPETHTWTEYYNKIKIYNDDYVTKTINGTYLGDHIILDSDFSRTVNAGKGNDVIEAGLFEDQILNLTGSAGNNIIALSSAGANGDSTTNITLTKGENLEINYFGNDYTHLNFSMSGNDGIIYNQYSFYDDLEQRLNVRNDKIVLKNLANNTVSSLTFNACSWYDWEIQKQEYDLLTYKWNITGVSPNPARGTGARINGTKLNENITGTDFADTINGGAGNDTISGGLGNDIITGGLGDNTVVYTKADFGTDTINLTAKENLTIDLSAYGYTSVNDLKGKVNIVGRNLEITLPKDETSNYGTIKLTNFAIANTVGVNGSVKVLLKKETTEGAGDAVYADLNSNKFFSEITTLTENPRAKSAIYNGNRFSETITYNNINNYNVTVNAKDGNNAVTITGDGITTVNGGIGADDVTVTSNNKKTILNLGNGDNIAEVSGGTGEAVINTGTGNDRITVSNSGKAVINTGTGDDTIISGAGNDIINAGLGADEITAGKGDDTITGGVGNDTFKFSTGDGSDKITDAALGDKIKLTDVTITTGETTLSGVLFLKAGNNLDIRYGNNYEDSITINNYFTSRNKIDALEDATGTTRYIADLINKYHYAISGQGRISGTNNADTIMGSKFNDIITAGNGNDTIYSSKGDDTITGGNGVTTIIYNTAGFGSDKINLTKGEKLEIDLSAYNLNPATEGDFFYEIKGKNLFIQTREGDITINNFAASDITGADGEVKIKLTNNDNDTINLKDGRLITVNAETNYTGGWLNENIDASSYIAKDRNGNEIATNTRGLVLNGGLGNDKIEGSKYNDTITGGVGENTVVIDGNKASIGTDTINLTKGEDLILNFRNYVGLNAETFAQKLKVNGRNLEIHLDNGTIVLANFAISDITDSIKVKFNDEEPSIQNLNNVILSSSKDDFTVRGNNATFTGSRFSENITSKDSHKATTINGGAGYNTITLNDTTSAVDTVNGGNDGNHIIINKDGNKTVTTGSGADIIEITAGEENTGFHTVNAGAGDNTVTIDGDGKATVTTGVDNDTITVKNTAENITINAGNGENTIVIDNTIGTNTITGGKDVDKFTLGSGMSTTTARLGDGENIANINHSGTSTIISGKDNDTINIAVGSSGISGTANIQAGAGQNTININNDVTFGTVTLLEERVGATNTINFAEDLTHDYEIVKSNNDLIIKKHAADGDSQITVKDYYAPRPTGTKLATIKFEVSGEPVQPIENGGDPVAYLTGLTGKDIAISGAGKIDGTDAPDTIYGSVGNDTINAGAGNDTINAGAGNDTITGGKDNDTINAGAGVNILNFAEGDGKDVVENGGGTDTLVFANGVKVSANISGNDLIVSYGTKGDTITLKDFSSGHSVKNIQIGGVKKAIDTYLPEPEKLLIKGVNLVQGTDNADNITVKTSGTNRIFAGSGNDAITTSDSQWATNYIYGGSGNDTITTGSGVDYIYGGSGENTIILGRGSGNDITLDENDNTFVFKDITNLNQLTFTGGSQDFLGTIADLTISGYGNSTDSLTIKNFFNLEGYDYSKIKLQAGANGTPVSLYELINESDLKTFYFTGTWKARPKAITTSPAQKATQLDSVIYGNNPGAGSHNVLLGTAGGNNTFYSGGGNVGIAGSGAYGMTMIYGGDGDETFHCEGNKIYFNDNGVLRTYTQDAIFVVQKEDGTKEVKTGVFYRTALGSEQPYSTYQDYYNETHYVYYTEDEAKIAQISDDDRFGTSFVCTSKNEIVNCIKSSTGIVNGGGGNDTFYTGFGANGDDGNDTIIGSGVMYGGRGDDKFYIKDEYNDSLFPMYNIYTNSGNDYIDTTQIANGDESILVDFGEGVNTLVVDGSRKINIGIDTTSTFREEEPVSKIIETRYSFQARNTHYTAFVQNGDLYIAANNSNKADSEEAVSYDGKGAGVLIIKGWSNLSDTQKDNLTITYRESLATTNYTSSTYTIKEFLKIIDGTSESFIADSNGRHTYINEYGNEKTNETYTFNVINNSNGALSTINENGETQVATRNTYDGWGDLSGTEQRAVDYFIIGGNGAQTIKGGDGNDVIYGDNINGHDNDGNYISSTGNDGADTIYGGKGNDYIIGGAGNDFIDGGSGTDYLDGGDGNDTLIGGTLGTEEEFNKSLLTSRYNLKEIHGGNGNDTIYSLGAYTNDVFDSEASKTYLGGNTYFTNNIYAGDGDDEIHANAYRDVVYAGKGDDTITSYAYANDFFYNSDATSEIYGEEGNDHIILKSHADARAYGGDGDDIIDASESEVIYYNQLDGGKGNDTIYGSGSNDFIYMGAGNDYVEAGGGDDAIYGLEGDNIVYAGAGNDFVEVSGTSKIYGEEGNDTIYIATGYRNVPSNLYIDGGDDDDTYITDCGYGFDTIVASKGNDVIEFKGFVKDDTSYQYNGNDLVLSYTNDGYPAGLILKDYKLGGFSDFTIKTFGGYDENYAQNGQYSMANFINYLNGNYSMATAGTEGNDAISATGNVNGLGGNDFILAHSTTSTEANPQIINTGSGNNSVVAQSVYTNITGGTGNDEYNLQSRITTLVDNGGNNTITAAPQGNYEYYLLDITLNGNGNNTITSPENANYSYYKINATGSGKQTIDINSANYTNSYDANTQLFTKIETGTGNDEIKLYLGTVESGAGDDTITVKNGAASGSYYTSGAILKGEEGNDNYIIEGGYDWQSENGISVNLKALIDDNQGNNEIKFMSEFMSHDNLNLLLNVKADGTLAGFKHYVYNSETGENDIVDTDYCGFIAGGMDFSYAGTVATASYNGWDVCDGVKFANKGTINNFSKIEASDGYYISQTTLSSVMEEAATWLTSGGRNYGSVMDAISPEGNFNQNNYEALYAIFNNENTWTQGA